MKKSILGILIILVVIPTFGQKINSDVFSEFDFRFIGPKGNRTIAVAGVPGDNNIAYIGAASGGLWKTIDAGLNWRPIFDNNQTIFDKTLNML